jgi:hypothetical protein
MTPVNAGGARRPLPEVKSPAATRKAPRHSRGAPPPMPRGHQQQLDLGHVERDQPRDEPWIPNHTLDRAEWDLRFVSNTRRQRPHWWLRTASGRFQLEFIERRNQAAA